MEEGSLSDAFFDAQITKQVDDLRENIAKDAEEIIKTKLPQKILHLTQLLSASTFSLPLDNVGTAGAANNLNTATPVVTKKRKLDIPLDDETAKLSDAKHTSNPVGPRRSQKFSNLSTQHVQAVIAVLKSG